MASKMKAAAVPARVSDQRHGQRTNKHVLEQLRPCLTCRSHAVPKMS
jgi:hypothetical protein